MLEAIVTIIMTAGLTMATISLALVIFNDALEEVTGYSIAMWITKWREKKHDRDFI